MPYVITTTHERERVDLTWQQMGQGLKTCPGCPTCEIEPDRQAVAALEEVHKMVSALRREADEVGSFYRVARAPAGTHVFATDDLQRRGTIVGRGGRQWTTRDRAPMVRWDGRIPADPVPWDTIVFADDVLRISEEGGSIDLGGTRIEVERVTRDALYDALPDRGVSIAYTNRGDLLTLDLLSDEELCDSFNAEREGRAVPVDAPPPIDDSGRMWVSTVDVPGRSDGLYLFEREQDAAEFSRAAQLDPDSVVVDCPVNDQANAAKLIAAERESWETCSHEGDGL